MEQKLLAAIYKDPRSDDARRVYADFLQERGDPRGEFIALQLAPKRTRNEQALLKKHSKAWLEPLQGALVEKSVKWARGFPVSGRANYSGALWKKGRGAALAAVEALSTVEALDLRAPNTLVDDAETWTLVKELPHLRTIHGLPRALLVQLAGQKKPYALENVETYFFGADEQREQTQKDALAAGMKLGVALPALTHLDICWHHGSDKPDDFAWVAETEAGLRLRWLRVEAYYFERHFAAWRSWFGALPHGSALEEVELRHGIEKSEYFISLRIMRRDGQWLLEGRLASEMAKKDLKKALATPGVTFDSVNVDGYSAA